MNTWLGRSPNLLKPQLFCLCFCKNKDACSCVLYLTRFATLKLTQKDLFMALRLRCVWIKERQKCAYRLTVCQTTRSAHPRRGVGFLTEYSYLKPRSLLRGCKRNRTVEPDRDSCSTRPVYTFNALCIVNECVTMFFMDGIDGIWTCISTPIQAQISWNQMPFWDKQIRIRVHYPYHYGQQLQSRDLSCSLLSSTFNSPLPSFDCLPRKRGLLTRIALSYSKRLEQSFSYKHNIVKHMAKFSNSSLVLIQGKLLHTVSLKWRNIHILLFGIIVCTKLNTDNRKINAELSENMRNGMHDEVNTLK